MKMYVDDLRLPTDDSWTVIRSVDEAIRNLQNGTVTEMSLDHDMGDRASEGGDCIRVVLWMCEYGFWPAAITLHTANPVGRDNMAALIDRYGPYARSVGKTYWTM